MEFRCQGRSADLRQFIPPHPLPPRYSVENIAPIRSSSPASRQAGCPERIPMAFRNALPMCIPLPSMENSRISLLWNDPRSGQYRRIPRSASRS
jgi:hypothetical protein